MSDAGSSGTRKKTVGSREGEKETKRRLEHSEENDDQTCKKSAKTGKEPLGLDSEEK